VAQRGNEDKRAMARVAITRTQHTLLESLVWR